MQATSTRFSSVRALREWLDSLHCFTRSFSTFIVFCCPYACLRRSHLVTCRQRDPCIDSGKRPSARCTYDESHGSGIGGGCGLRVPALGSEFGGLERAIFDKRSTAFRDLEASECARGAGATWHDAP